MLVPVAASASLVTGMRRVVRVGDRSVLVVVEADGPHAILDECPHYGVALSDGRWGNGTVECPWHRWVIDVRTGRCLHALATTPTFPVRQVDGQWQVEVPDGFGSPSPATTT